MISRAATAADVAELRRLMVGSGLPAEDLEQHLRVFRVVERDGGLIACAAVERHGSDGYLRSVAVAAEHRGAGLGAQLTDEILGAAAAESLRAVWLMTLTADRYFALHGFARASREEAPAWLRAHPHFLTYCPAGAILMRRSMTLD